MWGNCSNRLWDSLETYNSFLKSPQYRCFPMNFAKFLRTSFLQKTSGQLLLDFFYSFYCFACRWTYRNQSFYFWTCFITVFKRDEIMNLKDLVAAAWKHIFLGDIAWNLECFVDWLIFLYVLTEFLCSTTLNYSPMEHLNLRLNLKWKLRKQ